MYFPFFFLGGCTCCCCVLCSASGFTHWPRGMFFCTCTSFLHCSQWPRRARKPLVKKGQRSRQQVSAVSSINDSGTRDYGTCPCCPVIIVVSCKGFNCWRVHRSLARVSKIAVWTDAQIRQAPRFALVLTRLQMR